MIGSHRCWGATAGPAGLSSLAPATPAVRSTPPQAPRSTRRRATATCRLHVAVHPPVVTSTASMNTPRGYPSAVVESAHSTCQRRRLAARGIEGQLHDRPVEAEVTRREALSVAEHCSRSGTRASTSPASDGRGRRVTAAPGDAPSPLVQRPRAPRCASASETPSNQSTSPGPPHRASASRAAACQKGAGPRPSPASASPSRAATCCAAPRSAATLFARST